jgi:hypothetical protein
MMCPDVGDQHGFLQLRADTLSAAEAESKDCQMKGAARATTRSSIRPPANGGLEIRVPVRE